MLCTLEELGKSDDLQNNAEQGSCSQTSLEKTDIREAVHFLTIWLRQASLTPCHVLASTLAQAGHITLPSYIRILQLLAVAVTQSRSHAWPSVHTL